MMWADSFKGRKMASAAAADAMRPRRIPAPVAAGRARRVKGDDPGSVEPAGRLAVEGQVPETRANCRYEDRFGRCRNVGRLCKPAGAMAETDGDLSL